MAERAVISRQLPFDGKVFDLRIEGRKIPDGLAEACAALPIEIKRYSPLAIVCSLDLENKGGPTTASLHFPVEVPIKIYASLGALAGEKAIDKKAAIPRGVIFILEPEEFTDLPERQLNLLRFVVRRKVSRKKDGPPARKFWFIERTWEGDLSFPADDEDEERWKKFIKQIGLVKFEIGAGRSFGCRQKVKKEVKVDMREKSYYFPTQKGVVKEYNSSGFRVVSTEEIDTACKASKFVRRDYEHLKHGYGVWVEAECGCVTRMRLTGEETIIYNCDGDNCRFRAVEKEKVDKKPIFIGSRLKIYGLCGDCGKQLYVCARKGEINPKKGREITWNVFCEEDGLIRDGSFWTRKSIITLD